MTKKSNTAGYIGCALIALLGAEHVLNSNGNEGEDDLMTHIERASKLGQKILAPILYVLCIGGSVFFTLITENVAPSDVLNSDAWVIGGIVGGGIGWLLVKISYYFIKYAFIAIGMYSFGPFFFIAILSHNEKYNLQTSETKKDEISGSQKTLI